jgi:hypothetical protein
MICKDCTNVDSYFCFGSQMFQHHQRKHVGGTPEKSKRSSPVVKIEASVSSNVVDGSDILLEVDTASAGGALLHVSNNLAYGSNTPLEVDTDSTGGALLHISNNLAGGSNTLLEVDTISVCGALLHVSNNLGDGSNTLNFADGSDTYLGVGSGFDSRTLLEVSTSVMKVGTVTAGDGTGLEDIVYALDIAASLLKFTSDSNLLTGDDVSVEDSKPYAKSVVNISDVSVKDSKPSAKPVLNTSDVSVTYLKLSSMLVPEDKLDPNNPGFGKLSDEWWFIRNPTNNHRFIIHPVNKSIVDEFFNVKLIPESNYGFVIDTRLKQCTLGEDYAAICGKMVLFGRIFSSISNHVTKDVVWQH